MNEMPLNLADALVEVRRAYRLLHAYHRRLNDLLYVVHESLLSQGLHFVQWAPLNVDPLPPKRKPFFAPEHWAWDLTPAYQIVCIWQGFMKGVTNHVRIECVADTVYNDAKRKGEPQPSLFKPAESSNSELWISTWRARTNTPDWATAWNRIEHKEDVFDGNPHTTTVSGVQYAYGYFSRNLADLGDEHAVKEKLLRPLEQWIEIP